MLIKLFLLYNIVVFLSISLFMINQINQYTPMHKAAQYKEISRKLTTLEYQKVVNYFFEIGLKNGFMQSKHSATSNYTPIFDISGLS